MRYTVPAISLTLAVLGGCASKPKEVASVYVGAWAEIVSSQPANPVDGRQAIERFGDGRFKLVFYKSYASRQPCTGQWSVNEAEHLYRLRFATIACFGDISNKPSIGEELTFEILSVESNRLRFKAAGSSLLALWQARLEGGIE